MSDALQESNERTQLLDGSEQEKTRSRKGAQLVVLTLIRAAHVRPKASSTLPHIHQ